MRPPETRASLIVGLKDQRNEAAWGEFVSTYEPFLRHLTRRYASSEADAADITQQILIAIARSLEGWRDDGRPASFRRWLNRVARNAAMKWIDRQRRQVKGQGGSDFQLRLELQPDQAEVERQAAEYEREMILWAAEQVRGEFRPSSWRAFWAIQIEGRSVAETAEELSLSPGAIYMSKSRILARIRAKLQEFDDDERPQ
jgi:RNA polymerase sigma-70 factor (ECF subfamily)